MVVLKPGSAGGCSHIPLEEHSYRSAAASPGKETAKFTKKNCSSGSVLVLVHLEAKKVYNSSVLFNSSRL